MGTELTLLAARNLVKKERGKYKPDSEMYKKLDSQQLALKILCNSLYGATGVRVGKLAGIHISATVTAEGKRTILELAEKIAEKFDGDTDFSIGAGAKATFYKDDKLKIGGLIQVGWSQFDGRLKPDDWPTFSYPAVDSVEIEITEVQIAVGPAYEIGEDVVIYGGPFYHYVDGDLDDIYSAPEVIEDGGNISEYFITTQYSWSMEEDASYGGYIGTQLALAHYCSLNMEYQLTSSAYCIGASIIWRF